MLQVFYQKVMQHFTELSVYFNMPDEFTKLTIEKIVAGDARAFTHFVETHQRLVSHIVFRMIQNRADHEDLCQEVFLKAYENLSGFHFQAKVSTWLAKIAYNTCLNYLQKHRVPLFEDEAAIDSSFDDVPSYQPSPMRVLEFAEATERLQNEMNNLPVSYRTILTLYHLDELNYAEIGQVMDLPEGTVKSYLFRGRKMLQQKMMAKYQKEELC